MDTIEISEELRDKLDQLRQEGGYASIEASLAQAVDRHLRDIRQKKTTRIAERIRKGLEENGITEEDVLKDFEAFRERLRQDESAS